ncbi:hypothetical protein [Nocardia farcinica]|uniref:hypothetical protein n=1 Tax=Nocardia farcinica TaxID=37329 RepID=UPI001894FB62|nr:hypothetical protein [Nocardia farcinica]MBF6233892.1 hypothetical protein [Nocardia farcinica]
MLTMENHVHVDGSGNGRRFPGPPMTYQRPWTAADDAVVRLRRCREPQPLTGLLYQNAAPRTVEPLELEIAQALPDVCSRHGRPAPTRTRIRASFYDSTKHPRFHRITVNDPASKALSPMSTIVVGPWPVCDRCRNGARRLGLAAAVLGAIMGANLLVLVVLIVAAWMGWKADFDTVVQPLVWAFFPGTVPIGLGVVALLLRKRVEPAVFRPIYDERFAFVQAHPRFRAAVEAMASSPPAEER